MKKQRITANHNVNLQTIFEEYISEKRTLNTSKATITSYSNTFNSFYNCCQDRNTHSYNYLLYCDSIDSVKKTIKRERADLRTLKIPFCFTFLFIGKDSFGE